MSIQKAPLVSRSEEEELPPRLIYGRSPLATRTAWTAVALTRKAIPLNVKKKIENGRPRCVRPKRDPP